MELRINEVSFPEAIEFNFDEIKQELATKVEHYKGLVYTDDQIKEAKADVASLRKFTKALSDERIKVKKQCLKPYEAFEAKVAELTAIVNEPILLIDKQVKEYDELKKQEKQDAIVAFFNSCEAPEWLHISKIMNEKWLNASTSMKSIQEDIIARIEQIKTDLDTLSNLPEFGFEASEVYKNTLDINKALNEGKKLAEIQRKKAEFEATQAAKLAEQMAEAKKQEPQPQPAKDDFMNPPEPLKQCIRFQAMLSTEDALALKAFFESRNIEYKPI